MFANCLRSITGKHPLNFPQTVFKAFSSAQIDEIKTVANVKDVNKL